MTDGTVVPILPDGLIPASVMEPDKALIDKLEALLVDARAGHLRAMGYVLVKSNRLVGTGWIGRADSHDMTAGVASLFHRYMSEVSAA